MECLVPHDDPTAQAGLEGLGFVRQGSRWVAFGKDAAEALALEMRVIDLAVGNSAFAQLKMWRVDAVSRYGNAVGTAWPS